MVKKTEENENEKLYYNESNLQEFKELILSKLELARYEFNKMQKSLQNPNENSDETTSNQYLTMNDGASTFEKENLNQLAARQKKFIYNLYAALVRIENKTYGVCRVTGKLIQKERLLAVPHATLSIEAKNNQYK